MHCAVLEPERYASDYITAPDLGDGRTKEGKIARAEFKVASAGKLILSESNAAAIREMHDSIRTHPLASKMLEGGLSEVTVTWRDESGLYCCSRADKYHEDRALVVDLKSAADASEAEFRRSVAKWRYHVQDALYRFGFGAVDAPIQHFMLVAVEKTPPFAVAVYTMDPDAIGRGYSAARHDIDILAECMETDRWPGYPEHIKMLDLPPWA